MTGDEEWVEAAMSDDNMVVELLLRLNQSNPRMSATFKQTALPLEWSVRQRRSKPIAIDSAFKPAFRGSPTTPLSWSGATSISGGCVGSAGTVDVSPEESSRSSDPKLSKPTRSEVCNCVVYSYFSFSVVSREFRLSMTSMFNCQSMFQIFV